MGLLRMVQGWVCVTVSLKVHGVLFLKVLAVSHFIWVPCRWPDSTERGLEQNTLARLFVLFLLLPLLVPFVLGYRFPHPFALAPVCVRRKNSQFTRGGVYLWQSWVMADRQSLCYINWKCVCAHECSIYDSYYFPGIVETDDTEQILHQIQG